MPEVTIARLGWRDTGNFFLLCQAFREANSLIDCGAHVLLPTNRRPTHPRPCSSGELCASVTHRLLWRQIVLLVDKDNRASETSEAWPEGKNDAKWTQRPLL